MPSYDRPSSRKGLKAVDRGPTYRYGQDDGPYERIRWIGEMYDKYDKYWQAEIERYRRNARFAWGLNFGQWPSYVVEKLREEGRRPPTYNVTGDKIEKLVGSFIANGFEIKYQPVVGKIDSLTLKLQDMWMTDRSLLHYESSERVALYDCFAAGVGYERMYISDEYNEFGNIAWEPVDPIHVLLSPAWKSPYVRDLRDYITWSHQTVTEIVHNYPAAAAALKEQYEREMTEGADYGMYSGAVSQYAEAEDKWGDRHQVIELHWVEEKLVDWEFDLKNGCAFPETGFTPGSDDDRAAKTQYIKMMGLDTKRDITWTKKRVKVKYYEAVVPSLDRELMLAKGKDKIQTNNVNLYPLGRRNRTQYRGITDDLYDLAMGINRGELTMDDMHMRSAKGAFLLDKAITGGDPVLQQEIEQGWNDPAFRGWTDEGALQEVTKPLIELPGGHITADWFRHQERKYDLTDRLSLTPAAQDARTEGPNESGKLFQSKYQAGLIGQRPYMAVYEDHKREKAGGYARQAKITYAGLPREFSGADGVDGFVINQPAMDGFGRRIVLDDISKLPMMKVVTVASKMGPEMRSEMRSRFGEMLQVVQGDPANRLVSLIMLEGVAETEDYTEEKKEELRNAFGLLKQEAALATTNNILMAEQNLQKLQMRAQATPGGQGAGGGQPPQQTSQGEPNPEQLEQGTPQQEFTQIGP